MGRKIFLHQLKRRGLSINNCIFQNLVFQVSSTLPPEFRVGCIFIPSLTLSLRRLQNRLSFAALLTLFETLVSMLRKIFDKNKLPIKGFLIFTKFILFSQTLNSILTFPENLKFSLSNPFVSNVSIIQKPVHTFATQIN